MKEILQHLKINGEQSDLEIAAATGMSQAAVRIHLSELAANKEVMLCNSIRFVEGQEIEGIRCRLSGYIPKTSPGKKPKVHLKLS